eukprot:SAG31_NODE_1156_length_9616_cov_26.963014_6_plen_95_part_00
MRRERTKAKQKVLADYAEYKATWRSVHAEVLEQRAEEERERQELAQQAAREKAAEEKRLEDIRKAKEAAEARALLGRPERDSKPSTLLSEDFAL